MAVSGTEYLGKEWAKVQLSGCWTFSADFATNANGLIQHCVGGADAVSSVLICHTNQDCCLWVTAQCLFLSHHQLSPTDQPASLVFLKHWPSKDWQRVYAVYRGPWEAGLKYLAWCNMQLQLPDTSVFIRYNKDVHGCLRLSRRLAFIPYWVSKPWFYATPCCVKLIAWNQQLPWALCAVLNPTTLFRDPTVYGEPQCRPVLLLCVFGSLI